MTRDERAAARARCEAATPGPWRLVEEPPGVNADIGVVAGDAFLFAADLTQCENLDFAAHARTALPAALDEIDRLEAEVGRLREQVAAYTERIGGPE